MNYYLKLLKNILLYEINKPLIEGNFFKILNVVTKLIPIMTNKSDITTEKK